MDLGARDDVVVTVVTPERARASFIELRSVPMQLGIIVAPRAQNLTGETSSLTLASRTSTLVEVKCGR